MGNECGKYSIREMPRVELYYQKNLKVSRLGDMEWTTSNQQLFPKLMTGLHVKGNWHGLGDECAATASVKCAGQNLHAY